MSALEIITLPSNALEAAYRPGHYTCHEGRARYTAYLAEEVAALTDGPVLDVGCGVGHLLDALSKLRIPAAGFDISPAAVAEAGKVPGVRVLRHDANNRWPFPDKSFEAVTMFDVIEHFTEYDRALAEAGRVLRDGGWIFLVTVNRLSLLRFLLGPRWGAFKDPEHVTYFGRHDLGTALERTGFEILDARTFFNLGVAGESADFLRPARIPGVLIFSPEFGDSIYVLARTRS